MLQGTAEYLFFAALSKLFAAVTTYPYQVIRARLQDQDSHHTKALACVRDTLRYEGVRGLYKGLTPYLVHVLPNICMVFLIYEKMTNGQQQQQQQSRQQVVESPKPPPPQLQSPESPQPSVATEDKCRRKAVQVATVVRPPVEN